MYLHTGMKYRTSQFDMSEMSRAFRHPFSTRLTFKVSVYGSHPWIHQSSNFRPVCGLVHHLRVLNFRDRVRFLSHVSAHNERKEENIRFLREKGYRTELRVLCEWVPQNKQTGGLAWLQKVGRANTKKEQGVKG